MRAQSRMAVAVVVVAALTGACSEKIIKVVEVASVSVTAASPTIVLAGSTQLTASARDDQNNVLTNRPVSWSSSNTAVATVSGSGLVQGVGAGSATIEARIEGVAGSAAIAVNNPVPIITATSPSLLTISETSLDLTVTGTGFVQGAVVLWNGQQRPTQFVSGTSLRATLTSVDVSATGRRDVSVRNPTPGGGTSTPAGIDVVYPLPTVTALAPTFVMVGDGAFEIVVTGSGFVSTSVVQWNQTPRTTQFVNSSTLRVTIPAIDAASAAAVAVAVRNPEPGGGLSAVRQFEVRNPAPVATSVSPNSVLFGGTSFEVTVTGTGFVPGSVIRWNGQPRQTTVVSGTTVRATVPSADIATPGLINIDVLNAAPGGGTSAAQSFITRINPPGKSLAARAYHNCAVRANGEAYCWGLNEYGQLGDGTTTDRLTPTRVQATVPFVSVVVGEWHACGLTPWGAAYCWGSGGVLGRSSAADSPVPVPVDGGHAFTHLTAGSSHTCGLTAAQTIYCWGSNWDGQLGNNSTANSATPVAAGTSAQRWRALGAGYSHTCAISTTSQLSCWGSNASGQLGDGSTTRRLSPVPVTSGTSFTAVAGGSSHTCAIAQSAAVFCWGYGFDGQLGNGVYGNSVTPVAVSSSVGFTTISSSGSHTCGTSAAGSTYCWGAGWDSQLGDGGLGASNLPTLVLGLTPSREIAVGELHSCALGNNNAIYCWGARTFGALGDGVSAVRASPAAVSGAASGYTATTAGVEFSCGLFGTAARCWGRNAVYQIGDNTTIDRLVPSPVLTTQAFASISAGLYHACGLTAAGAAYCWGGGWDGRLGNGTVAHAVAPIAVSGGNIFRQISSGNGHTCGVTTAGAVRCWGYNRFGQLGDGSAISRLGPTPIIAPAGVTFASVSAGDAHTCAVTTTGVLYCWGHNLYGRLGIGNETDQLTPVTVPVGAPVQMVSAGVFHTCALTTAGAARCWGWGGAGALGHGAFVGTTSSPVTVAGSRTFRTIHVGQEMTCGITTAGEAFCWGLNHRGQLGTGNIVWVNTPTAVAGGGTYTDVQTAQYHTCGLTTAGAVRCWGHGKFGELGINLLGYVTSPTAVQGGLTFGAARCEGADCVSSLTVANMSGALRLTPRASTGTAGIRHSGIPTPRATAQPRSSCGPDTQCRPVSMPITRR